MIDGGVTEYLRNNAKNWQIGRLFDIFWRPNCVVELLQSKRCNQTRAEPGPTSTKWFSATSAASARAERAIDLGEDLRGGQAIVRGLGDLANMKSFTPWVLDWA